MQPLFLRLGTTLLCIINCYLPSGNASAAISRFCEDLAIIQAIVEKYMTTHSVIIAGDLNADILHRNSKKEKMILKLIQDLNLAIIVNNKENSGYTFRHKSLDNVTSCLDYFITTEDISADLEVLHDIVENTSAHSPVRIKLQINVPKPNSQNHEQANMIAKRMVKWKQGNPKGYSNMLESSLEGHL